MWFSTLGILGCLVGIVVCLLVAHHDGVMVGQERAYRDIECRRRAAERRMREASDTVTSCNTSTTSTINGRK